MIRTVAALAALLPALPAAAQFEGVAHVEMSQVEETHRVDGKGRLYVSPKAWRMEMEVRLPGGAAAGKSHGQAMPQRFVVFGEVANPHKSWMLNEKDRTYAVVVDEDHDQPAPDEQSEGWKITRLGADRVGGFACTNVKAEKEGGEESWEACLAKDFLSGDWLEAMKQSDEEDWLTAAKRAGVIGYPVRMIARGPDGAERERFEVTRAERKRLPASLFRVPAGYREKSVLEVMGPIPGQQEQMEEMRKQMDEAMKNMSPEQRKALEDAMKRMGRQQ